MKNVLIFFERWVNSWKFQSAFMTFLLILHNPSRVAKFGTTLSEFTATKQSRKNFRRKTEMLSEKIEPKLYKNTGRLHCWFSIDCFQQRWLFSAKKLKYAEIAICYSDLTC